MGWVYNLQETDPNSSIPEVIAICLAFSIFSLLAVCLRFYVRMRSKRLPWYDDYAALASSLLTLAYAGIAVAQTRWGQGLTAAYFPPENVITFSKVGGDCVAMGWLTWLANLTSFFESQIQYAGGPVYCLDVLGFKVALLTSYLRIAGVVKLYRKIIIAAIILCVVNQLVFALIISISCMPASNSTGPKQWDTSLKGHCIQTQPFYFALGGTSIALDFIIIALPLPVLWKLQLRIRQKVLLVALFALGFFVTIVQFIRIFTVKDLKTYTDSKNIVLWSLVEVSLGKIVQVVVCCIPTYGPLFKAFASNISSYRNRSYQLGSMPPESRTAPAHSRRRSRFDIMPDPEGNTVTVVGSGNGKTMKDTDSEEHILSGDDNLKVFVTSEISVREA
ncbi:hypothetical protein N7481_006136 [Penicillium waksmanii]|uniref:uncharacterized protein n=1 Tax=Penicillium waksmanii TaxID=69791 RepID=UPI0025484E1B|nr:uncharacterized protein N7481_006136 [Penicillium waksmanii]KAJ5984037.1 hypothetical protein N7481_006136 [Penicillium waksmanii]